MAWSEMFSNPKRPKTILGLSARCLAVITSKLPSAGSTRSFPGRRLISSWPSFSERDPRPKSPSYSCQILFPFLSFSRLNKNTLQWTVNERMIQASNLFREDTENASTKNAREAEELWDDFPLCLFLLQFRFFLFFLFH